MWCGVCGGGVVFVVVVWWCGDGVVGSRRVVAVVGSGAERWSQSHIARGAAAPQPRAPAAHLLGHGRGHQRRALRARHQLGQLLGLRGGRPARAAARALLHVRLGVHRRHHLDLRGRQGGVKAGRGGQAAATPPRPSRGWAAGQVERGEVRQRSTRCGWAARLHRGRGQDGQILGGGRRRGLAVARLLPVLPVCSGSCGPGGAGSSRCLGHQRPGLVLLRPSGGGGSH